MCRSLTPTNEGLNMPYSPELDNMDEVPLSNQDCYIFSSFRIFDPTNLIHLFNCCSGIFRNNCEFAVQQNMNFMELILSRRQNGKYI